MNTGKLPRMVMLVFLDNETSYNAIFTLSNAAKLERSKSYSFFVVKQQSRSKKCTNDTPQADYAETF